MMKCDDAALAALLNTYDDLGEQDTDLSEHVESCKHCQTRLSEMAADAEQWDAVSRWLSPSEVTSEIYSESLDARERWKRPTAWSETMAKSLLSAASHPEMLGRIGRYDVERLIGSGGMGVVFKAYDTELNRPVAVKLLAPYLAGNGAARKRFAREARAAAAVVDDHVVPIHNVETESEHPFLVMKFIGGGSLQQRIDRDGPLDVCEVLRIGMQTAKGLAAAHAQGLIHRDVKPSNILLDEGVDRALLTDFGLARATDDASLTRSGFHPGTPHYMSPEQVRGDAIDARSDLFGLGCVLYSLCTGHPPFRAETSYAVLRRIIDDSPRSIRETNPEVPEWLERVVMKLLAKSAVDRFDSASQVAELLEGCLAHVQKPTAIPLPDGVLALAAQTQPRASEIPKPNRLKAIHQRIPPIAKYIAAAAGSFALIFAGILIVLELDKGTLTIESELDDVPIRIMQGDEVVKSLTVSKEGATTRIGAGKYIVEIGQEFDKAVIKDSGVELSRGATAIVKVKQTNAEHLESAPPVINLTSDTLTLTDVEKIMEGLLNADLLRQPSAIDKSKEPSQTVQLDGHAMDFLLGLKGDWKLDAISFDGGKLSNVPRSKMSATIRPTLAGNNLEMFIGSQQMGPAFEIGILDTSTTPMQITLNRYGTYQALLSFEDEVLTLAQPIRPGEPRPQSLQPAKGIVIYRWTRMSEQAQDRDSFVTIPLKAEWVPEEWLKRNMGRRHLTIVADGIIEDEAKPNVVSRVQRGILHDCRLESYEKMSRDGVEYWNARFFVPRKPVYSIGALWFKDAIRNDRIGDRHTPVPSPDLTQDNPQVKLDEAMKEGHVFRLDYVNDDFENNLPMVKSQKAESTSIQETADSLVTITFTGTTDGASITASGIGWRVDDAGHILLPSHVVAKCDDEAIQLRYASGVRCSATRLKTLGHLTLLKSDQVAKGPAISLDAVVTLTSGDAVSAILNGTDNVPGSIVKPRTTIAISELEGVKINPELRLQNIITTDLVADDTTLSGAPLLTKDGDIAGMIIRLGSAQLIAIPVAEIREVLKQLQQVANSDPIRDHGLSTESIETRTDGRFGILKIIEPTSLEDAVTKFNLLAKEHPLGRAQPELTVQEMTAAFRLWIASDECNEATRKDFQQVLDTQMLRSGHILQFNTKFQTDGHLFEVWSIQFGDDNSYAWFKIRDSKLLSRLKSDEERKAWEQQTEQMKKSFRESKRWGDRPKAYDANPIGPAQTSSTEVALGEGPDIAELLETASKHEEWVSKIRSVHFRATGKNFQSEKALEVERAKLIARGADAVVPIKSPSLLPSFEFSDEIAWDGKQVANIRNYSLGLDNSHWVWDGTQFTTFQDGTNAAYILDNEEPTGMETPLSGVCYWPFDPRFALRTKASDIVSGFAADDFTLHTPDLFHGVHCHRLVSIDKQIALFIAVDSGLIIGKREGILTEPIVPILKSLGHEVKNADEARNLLSELEPAQLLEVRRAGEQMAKKLATDTLLNGPILFEMWVTDFQPTPLGVFPMKHYQRVSGVDADVPYESYRIESEVVELKANAPIDSTLFEIEFRDGVAVVDNRFETPITYSYDSKMTSEDLKALVQKSLESVNELDALVGKPLPALTNLSWINTESRGNASFNGRPLIVECWAVGCGPCRNHFATLNSLFEAGKIQVLGFHTATKDVEAITRFAQNLKLNYPIVVDTGDDSKNAFGPLPVTRMPYTILVDASGTIVAHGNLETLLPKALEMVASNKPVAAQSSEPLVTVPPMEFDTLEDFLKPGRELFDKEMKQIDERLAKVVEGSAEHSLLTTKKKQLQQQWDLSVAQVKGMAAAAKAGKPVQLAPIVIPNNSRPWQAPMPDPLLGHDEEIAKVLAGTWQVKRYVADGEEAPLDCATVTFSKNMWIMHFKLGDEQGDIQQVFRIGNDKIDIWDTDSGPDIRTALPYLGSFSLDNDTLRICYHGRAMELETPQSRPPVQPGKGFIYLELQRVPIAEFGLMVDDKNSAKSSSHSNETRIDPN